MNNYQFYKSMGICCECQKRKAEPNLVRCWECNEKHKKRNSKRRNELEKPTVNTTVQKRIELGICTLCGKRKAQDGKRKCGICLVNERNKQRERRKAYITRSERKSYGMCYICGIDEIYEDTGLCKKHYDIASRNLEKGRNPKNIRIKL